MAGFERILLIDAISDDGVEAGTGVLWSPGPSRQLVRRSGNGYPRLDR
jgi:hypothetical protein